MNNIYIIYIYIYFIYAYNFRTSTLKAMRSSFWHIIPLQQYLYKEAVCTFTGESLMLRYAKYFLDILILCPFTWPYLHPLWKLVCWGWCCCSTCKISCFASAEGVGRGHRGSPLSGPWDHSCKSGSKIWFQWKNPWGDKEHGGPKIREIVLASCLQNSS